MGFLEVVIKLERIKIEEEKVGDIFAAIARSLHNIVKKD